jgi:methylated-DNA-protein-cysteine methyltransferase related protein
VGVSIRNIRVSRVLGGNLRKQSGTQQQKKKSHAKILVVFADTVRKIPKGKVATYGQVAAAAGFPGAARQVVRALHSFHGLPWHRVLGAGGAIRVPGEDGLEQRLRLEMEGVTFRGRRVNMDRHQFRFRR